VDVLVDDSPANIRRAGERGIVAATLIHPWNRELVEAGAAIGADDWFGLRELLEPVLSGT
jgi:uncharacterized protein